MKTWSVARTSLYAGAVVVAIHATLLASGNSAVLHGILLDHDCYMHLERALRMMVDGNWHDTPDPRLNAPFGYSIHWTALFDSLLVAGATPFTWFGLDRHTALYVWGSAISPILLIAALSVLAWGVRPRVQGAAFLWLTVLLFTQFQLAGSFIVGRPDHHSLVIGLLFAQLAWAYALFDGRVGSRTALVAGVMAGLQMSTSVEALLTILLISTAIVSAWLFYGRRHLDDLALYLGACAATVLLWLIWEGGQHLVEPAYARVSIVHVVVLTSAAFAVAMLSWADRRMPLSNPKRQIGAIVATAALAALPTSILFPDFFLGPWPHLDPVIAAWHKQIAELQPLAPTNFEELGGFLTQMTGALLAVPFTVRRLLHGTENDKPIMMLSLIGLLLFGTLTMFQGRWCGEVQAIMLLPWTLTTMAIMKSTAAISVRKVHIPIRAFVLSAALMLQMVPASLAQGALNLADITTHPAKDCRWDEASIVLGRSVPGRQIVIMPVWYGPDVLWRSDLRVLAGPYEIPPAFADTDAFFKGNEQAAHAVVARRGISYALVCKHETGNGLGEKLASGIAPKWMKPVPFKDGPAEFRLYRVDY